MTAEEIKALDAITKKFAHELGEFERTHGTINGGFATGLFRKLATEYASQQRTEWIKQGFEAARDVESECKVWNCEGNVRKYPTADDYLNSKP